MSILKELDVEQINELIGEAVEKQIPAMVTVGSENQWENLHTRVLSVRGSHLLLEFPVADEGHAPWEFVPAERIGINFKLRHHKHIFSATVVGLDEVLIEGDVRVPALVVVLPTRMQRLGRRAFNRVDVPENRIVRVSFWLGGRDAEPTANMPENPVWTGLVNNLSAGGLQIEVDQKVTHIVEPGDVLGVRISFGAAENTIYADALFRHAQPAQEGKVYMGLQFLGLTESPQGLATLQFISSKVNEFEHIQTRAQAYHHN
jgi:c-di-GMP-binding flagellar brake protein YcgR